MTLEYRGPSSQRGESIIWPLLLIAICWVTWVTLDAAEESRDAKALRAKLSAPAEDRSERLAPAFYRLAEAALVRESVRAPVGAWTIQQGDEKLSIEQLLVLHRDQRFSVRSRTTLLDKDGNAGRVSGAKGVYQVKGSVLNLIATSGSPAWNGPYIIESVDQKTLTLRLLEKDVVTYRAVPAAEVPALVAKLKDQRSDAEVASSNAAARFADKLTKPANDGE